MSIKHPVIAVTGSSGAGTSTVKKVFENIFRREGVRAAVIEGDSFHRYDRAEMMVLYMVRKGLFGEILHGEGGYLHEFASLPPKGDPGFDAATLTTRLSAAGTYLGITVTITATSRAQLDALYRALSTNPMVKVVL